MSTATMYARRNQNLYRQSASLRLGPISVGFVTVAIITVLALLYLTQVTKTSVYGYKLSELTQQKQQLEQQHQELQVLHQGADDLDPLPFADRQPPDLARWIQRKAVGLGDFRGARGNGAARPAARR